MPSPFPGMDPYLESPAWWRNLHNRMMAYIADELNTILPENYFATMDERLYVAESDRDIYPDVSVIENRSKPGSAQHPVSARSAEAAPRGAAVLDPPLLIQVQREREVFVEVRRSRGRGDSEVVTAIELLSPANKLTRTGRDAYRQKQREVSASGVHLLEIDLIRAGKSPLLPTPEQLSRKMPYDYAMSLHRAGEGTPFAVWLRTVRQPLPRTLFVPLTSDENDDVLLNLQQIFERSYDIGRYQANVYYSAPLVPPLNAEDAAWADALLREKGLRN